MIRIPARRGVGTRMELRMPDPSCNPYLAFAAMLSAGPRRHRANQLDAAAAGQQEHLHDERSASVRPQQDQRACRATSARRSTALEKDSVVREALGEHIFAQFVDAKKRQEWQDYIAQVHDWELERYLTQY